jgi:hypothetical protein
MQKAYAQALNCVKSVLQNFVAHFRAVGLMVSGGSGRN